MGKQKITKAALIAGQMLAVGVASAGSPGFSVASVALRMARVPVSAATTGERTYAFTFPIGAVIKSVYLDVSTREQTATTKTMHVGLLASETNGDADGFLVGVSTASVQVVGASLVAGSVTRGALLSEGSAASGRFPKSHFVTTGNAVTLSSTAAEAQTELVADIIVEYLAIG